MEDHRTGPRIDPRTDRLGVLLDQFDFARQIAQARLDGLASPASLPKGAPLPPRQGDGPLSDQEYLWEPAPGAWSIRRRGQAASPRPLGPGQWQLDSASGDPDPTPPTTIAWRLGHLHADVAGRWEWTFGQRRRPPEELVDFSPLAAVALGGCGRRWSAGVPVLRPWRLSSWIWSALGSAPGPTMPRCRSSPSSGRPTLS